MIRLERLNCESADARYCVAEELKDLGYYLSTDLIAHDVTGQWILEEMVDLLDNLVDLAEEDDYTEQVKLAGAYRRIQYFARSWDGLESPCRIRLQHLLNRLETIDYTGETEELELLGIIYGGTWEVRTLRGYSLSDWLKVYTRKSLSEDTLSLYENLVFKKGEAFKDLDSGETYFIDHDSIWSGRAKEDLAIIYGVSTDAIKIYEEVK